MRASLFILIATVAHAHADPAPKPKPWLGVTISDQGVRWGGIAILDVFEDTPASLCGLRPGDEIFAIDHVEVHGTRELQNTVGALAVGDRAYVEYVRGDDLHHCRAKLAEAVTDPTELLQRRVVDHPVAPFRIVRRGDGTALDDTTSRGGVLVLALISTSCEACVATLAELADAVAGTGAELLAVTADGDSAADAFVQRTGVTVELGLEDAASGLVRRYLADRDDASILIVDHEGMVRFAAVGAGVEAANLDGAAFCAARAERARRKAK